MEDIFRYLVCERDACFLFACPREMQAGGWARAPVDGNARGRSAVVPVSSTRQAMIKRTRRGRALGKLRPCRGPALLRTRHLSVVWLEQLIVLVTG
jgi:hypothetical protein